MCDLIKIYTEWSPLASILFLSKIHYPTMSKNNNFPTMHLTATLSGDLSAAWYAVAHHKVHFALTVTI
jgi:hypothetical protein